MKYLRKTGSIIAIVAALWCCLTEISRAQDLKTVTKDTLLMGSAFEFTAIHDTLEIAEQAVDAAIAEVARIEQLISSWSPTSYTSYINDNAGFQPVPVPNELYELIRRSMKISRVSGGAFDITTTSLLDIWTFDNREMEMPSDTVLYNAVQRVGYEKIVLNKVEKTVFLPDSGMRIGFGGIGKGYAADMAKKTMESFGVLAGAVNAGGDLLTWGTRANGKDWVVGIRNPMDNESLLCWVNTNNRAIVTSGDYERYVMIDGKRYGHILHPKTGKPCRGVISCTVISTNAEIADGLATALFVLGIDLGIELANKLIGVEALMVDEEGEVYYSNGFQKQTIPWLKE